MVSRGAALGLGAFWLGALGLGVFGLSDTAFAEEDNEMHSASATVTTDPSADADVLNLALTLERLGARSYEDALDPTSSSGLPHC